MNHINPRYNQEIIKNSEVANIGNTERKNQLRINLREKGQPSQNDMTMTDDMSLPMMN